MGKFSTKWRNHGNSFAGLVLIKSIWNSNPIEVAPFRKHSRYSTINLSNFRVISINKRMYTPLQPPKIYFSTGDWRVAATMRKSVFGCHSITINHACTYTSTILIKFDANLVVEGAIFFPPALTRLDVSIATARDKAKLHIDTVYEKWSRFFKRNKKINSTGVHGATIKTSYRYDKWQMSVN